LNDSITLSIRSERLIPPHNPSAFLYWAVVVYKRRIFLDKFVPFVNKIFKSKHN